MRWTDRELRAELARYEEDLVRGGLGPYAVRGYVDHARRFLRWRMGDYRPRGASSARRIESSMASTDIDRLTSDLAEYQAALLAAGLQRPAVYTYLDQSQRFLHWLAGSYAPGRPREPVPPEPAPSSPSATGNSSWLWEGNVQAALARYLEAQGWHIDRQADTAHHERGYDLVASMQDRRLAVEVKGYPERTYSRGAKEGQRKVAVPSAQATTYFGGALASVTKYRETESDLELAIGLPDVPRYRDLAGQRATSLRDLGVGVLLVAEDGTVAVPIKPAHRAAPAITPEALFEEAFDWFHASYGERRYFVERDVVWTLQTRLLALVRERTLPWQVRNDYAALPGLRRSLSADLAIVVDGAPGLLVEFKYEPSHQRTDIAREKLPVIGWADVVKDAERAQRFVDLRRTPVALALLIDEGGYFGGRPALPGGQWVEWGSAGDPTLSVAAHVVRVPST
jgi:hypothetical protein